MSEETPEMLAALGLHGTAKVPGPVKAKATRAAKARETRKAAAAPAPAEPETPAGDQTMVGNGTVVDPPPPGTEAPAPDAPAGEVQTWEGSPGVVPRKAG